MDIHGITSTNSVFKSINSEFKPINQKNNLKILDIDVNNVSK